MTDLTATDASLGRPAESGHSAPTSVFSFPPPLTEPELGRRRSPAEEARTLVESTRLAALATNSEDGSPWSSIVGYGVLPDGALALVVSTLAEHGRNLARDARASVAVAMPPAPGSDPLDSGRVTLSGRVQVPRGDEATAALEAYCASYPAARAYARFGDFTLYVLHIERLRWVGGFGRMDSATGDDYRAATPDPTEPGALEAAEHLNADHADALLLIAQEVAGYSDATAATCERIDRLGMDLQIRTLRGAAPARVGWVVPAEDREGLRATSIELVLHARAKREG